jgi:hypothetical protein
VSASPRGQKHAYQGFFRFVAYNPTTVGPHDGQWVPHGEARNRLRAGIIERLVAVKAG